MPGDKLIDKLKGPDGSTMRSTSHGRGGAGNINSKPINNGTDPKELETPHIKSQNYTTGRGGTGNIVPNENAASARAAQDVDTPAHHSRELTGTHHWGRGGEGNMVTLKGNSNGSKKERTASGGQASQRRPSFQGVMDRGKSMLGLGKKEGTKPGSESAVEE